MLKIQNIIQFPLILLGIMMITSSNSQASPLPEPSNPQVFSLPKLPKNNLRLQQLSDGFLDNTGRREQLQVTSVSELQDVTPTQWAYEALRKLVERYGCVSGYPDRIFKGNRTLSRDEFASGINACFEDMKVFLENNTAVLREDIEKLKRLAYEFEAETGSLGSRVRNLESRIAYAENHQSSVTTLLTGEVIVGLTGITSGEKNQGTEDIFKVTNLGYRGRLKLNTTFDGDDSLYIRFTTGTAPSYPDITETFEGKLSFSQPDESDLAIQLIIYDFALAENVRMFVEPVGGAFDDFVPTVNFLDGDAASGALSSFGTRNPLYYMPGGPGVGFRGQIFEVFEWSGGYLADLGASPDLGAGMFNGPYGVMGQLAYEPNDNFKVAFTYLHGYNNLDSGTGSRRSNFQSFIEEEFKDFGASVDTINNSYRMEFSWHMFDQFVLGAWGGFTTTRTLGAIDLGKDLDPIGRGNLDIWNWSMSLAFPDAFFEGDTAAIIIGMEPWVSKSNLVLPNGLRNNDRDSSFHVEAIYEYAINDNISITPGIIIITSPDYDNSNDSLVIGTIRTTFTF
ncbi:S-layer OprB family carbohydrate-selective porin [cyanobacterium endosymbiont of Rhopalodia gibberula]|nr:S-layer OprB family carbohydrate-selective porin [cyanobacterium endosymbiont of Rhopalodia gibberula]